MTYNAMSTAAFATIALLFYLFPSSPVEEIAILLVIFTILCILVGKYMPRVRESLQDRTIHDES